LLAEQVLVSLLQSGDRLGQIVKAQAVGALPPAILVAIAYFQHHLAQWNGLAIPLNRVAKYRGPNGPCLEM